jgi:phosphoribosyl 1,2-cyclic phosphodiesterase
MRFCSLGSGSGGNATLVEAHSGTTCSRVLIDAGFSLRELDLRLARAGLTADDLDAVFVTHEHGDHIGCAVALARRQRIPLWMSRGTWRAIGEPAGKPAGEPALDVQLHFARDGQTITIGDLQLRPYTVPHDAAEPLQLRCSDGARTLGVLTDAGSATPHLLAQLQGCQALLLECNHDRELLAQSHYPASLKARVGGRLGHLANDTAAQILAACLHRGLQRLVAAHLSEHNNRPELARQALAGASGCDAADIVVADPRSGTAWLGVG